MSTYLTSDNHFDHKNIIAACERPFESVTKMNNTMVNNWNHVVKKDDEVYVLGDFFWGENIGGMTSILSRLNGIKHLVLGNHDLLKPWTYVNAGFVSVHTSYKLMDGVYLAHDPTVKNCLKKSDYLLCGHVHHLFKLLPDQNVYNVGVDQHDFKPVSLGVCLEQLRQGVEKCITTS